MGAIDVVSDASVAVQWFHAEDEEELEPSRALVDELRNRVVAVSLLDLTPYEVGNALLRGSAIPADRVATVLAGLDEICPRIAPTEADFREAAVLADRDGLTLYDAAYAAVARRRDARLVTLDRALLRAGLGSHPSELITELQGL